mmetsp:Transcript_110654/g.214289  ORF Transcript_110654/g.214289 Transcript_110654/m.214289 type:complete len:87 (-) Transcript_110654:21-281(-)
MMVEKCIWRCSSNLSGGRQERGASKLRILTCKSLLQWTADGFQDGDIFLLWIASNCSDLMVTTCAQIFQEEQVVMRHTKKMSHLSF